MVVGLGFLFLLAFNVNMCLVCLKPVVGGYFLLKRFHQRLQFVSSHGYPILKCRFIHIVSHVGKFLNQHSEGHPVGIVLVKDVCDETCLGIALRDKVRLALCLIPHIVLHVTF